MQNNKTKFKKKTRWYYEYVYQDERKRERETLNSSDGEGEKERNKSTTSTKKNVASNLWLLIHFFWSIYSSARRVVVPTSKQNWIEIRNKKKKNNNNNKKSNKIVMLSNPSLNSKHQQLPPNCTATTTGEKKKSSQIHFRRRKCQFLLVIKRSDLIHFWYVQMSVHKTLGEGGREVKFSRNHKHKKRTSFCKKEKNEIKTSSIIIMCVCFLFAGYFV